MNMPVWSAQSSVIESGSERVAIYLVDEVVAKLQIPCDCGLCFKASCSRLLWQ